MKRALILSGGGARAAYQAGALKAIAEIIPPGVKNPFRIICGTSAGAINAAALAAGAHDLLGSSEALCRVWGGLNIARVYRAETWPLLRTGGRWLAAFLTSRPAQRPIALLDVSPLRELLAQAIPWSAVRTNIEVGAIDALAITASSYDSGLSVSFCMGAPELEMWERAQRIGVRTSIGIDHLMASSAIPLLFPPVKIGEEYFGDGAIHQVAPTAPALHLGADRILVIGANRARRHRVSRQEGNGPSLAQIGGHVLASIFTDALGTDLEKVRLVNTAVRQIPADDLPNSPMPLRDVGLCVLAPSVSLQALAMEHHGRLPRSLRMIVGRAGGSDESGAALLSYLLFDAAYCRALINLGYRDAMAAKKDLFAFLRDD